MRRIASKAAKGIATALLFALVAVMLALVVVPRFLDRIYYRGPVSGHFDGERFFNPDGEDTARVPGGSGGRAGFLWRQITGADQRPPWPERVRVTPASPDALLQPFLAPIMYVPATQEDEAETPMMATWVGHATFLVQTPSLNILTDPIWSDTAGPFGIGPTRITEPGINFDDLPPISLVLISHNHYDHLDLATLKRLWQRDRPLIVTSLGNDAILRANGIPARGLDWQEVIVHERPGVSTHSFSKQPARVILNRNHHWGSRWFADRNRALWSSFVVTLPGGNLFFAGDTGPGDMRWPEEAARYGPVRLALIPIGAFRFSPGEMGTGSHISPVGAVEVFQRLGASSGIGMHWGTFRLSYEAYDTPPKMLDALMRCTGTGGRFVTTRIGEPVRIPPYAPPARPRRTLAECAKTPEVLALP